LKIIYQQKVKTVPKIYKKFTTLLHKFYILDINFLTEEESVPGNEASLLSGVARESMISRSGFWPNY